MNTVDARGLSCPIPVAMTQQALKSAPAALTVLVDNVTAKENVTRFAKNSGYRVSVSEADDEFTLTLEK